MADRPLIQYPAGWTLSVMDDPVAARSAVDELVAAGTKAEDVVVLEGPEQAQQSGQLKTSHGIAARVRRTMQFLTMDQMPDLHVYELAIAQGHPVLALHIGDSYARRRALEIVQRHGGHFINRFGDWATEEIAPWRGTMPDLPQHLQR